MFRFAAHLTTSDTHTHTTINPAYVTMQITAVVSRHRVLFIFLYFFKNIFSLGLSFPSFEKKISFPATASRPTAASYTQCTCFIDFRHFRHLWAIPPRNGLLQFK